jgi:hypothetical protein
MDPSLWIIIPCSGSVGPVGGTNWNRQAVLHASCFKSGLDIWMEFGSQVNILVYNVDFWMHSKDTMVKITSKLLLNILHQLVVSRYKSHRPTQVTTWDRHMIHHCVIIEIPTLSFTTCTGTRVSHVSSTQCQFLLRSNPSLVAIAAIMSSQWDMFSSSKGLHKYLNLSTI